MSEIKLKKSKSITAAAAALAFLVIIALSLFQLNYNRQMLPVDPEDKTQIDVVIPANSSARQIAAALKTNNLIRNESIFLTHARRTHQDSRLKAGHYRFSPSQSVQEITAIIAAGKVVTNTLTIPEGFTVQQVGELLVIQKFCTPEEWKAALQKDYNYDFLPKGLVGERRLEGFLFPDTYSLPVDTSPEQVIELMLKNFDSLWKKDFAGQAQKQNMDVHRTVIIASMVEREAMRDAERKTIAGVIYNRLQKNMPLQIDATVVYALGVHRDIVTNKDLQVNSPYNTYKYAGLPPGPISCPGKASIAAALNPQKHSYFYYLSKGDGSHYFSRTYAEHLQAKKKYID